MLWTPLDCAASRGWTWCVECLLDADAQISPTDKTKVNLLFNINIVQYNHVLI